MSDEQITEAASAVQVSIGASSYLHGIGYDVEQFRKELKDTLKHIKSKMPTRART
ncbi:MAG: hypothetical protein HYX87_07175 [Chloroflexi bacterium]|nr:hypothetical protein [Chloroflexota bacterium]